MHLRTYPILQIKKITLSAKSLPKFKNIFFLKIFLSLGRKRIWLPFCILTEGAYFVRQIIWVGKEFVRRNNAPPFGPSEERLFIYFLKFVPSPKGLGLICARKSLKKYNIFFFVSSPKGLGGLFGASLFMKLN